MLRKLSCLIPDLVLAVALGFVALGTGIAQSEPGPEEYQAVAMGQGDFMGQIYNVTIHISSYSTDAERQALVDTFDKGGSAALATALTKQQSHGNVEFTGTTGVDISYARKMPGADGGTKIRIMANHPITLGGAESGISNNALSAIELNLVPQKGKSTGILWPASIFVINKQTHELEADNYQSPWSLADVKLRNEKR
jgi:hypothetical protein